MHKSGNLKNILYALIWKIFKTLFVFANRYALFLFMISALLVVTRFVSIDWFIFSVALLLIKFSMWLLFFNVNDYLCLSRFGGTLGMRMDVNTKKLESTRSALKMGRDQFLTIMFVSGIKSIKKMNKLEKCKSPCLFFSKTLKVSTNESIFEKLDPKYKVYAVEHKTKIIPERLFFIAYWKLMKIVVCPNKMEKLSRSIFLSTKTYKFIILIDKI